MATINSLMENIISKNNNLMKKIRTVSRKNWAIAAGVGVTYWAFSSMYKKYTKEISFSNNILEWIVMFVLPRASLTDLTGSIDTREKDLLTIIPQRTQNPSVYNQKFKTWTKKCVSVEVDEGKASIETILHYKTCNSIKRPLFFWIHGGGFVVGQARADYLGYCTDYLDDRVVASVEYRLAPEYKFPTAPNDCLAALEHLVKNAEEYGIDTNNITVAGFSAGGNLAAVVTQMAKEKSGIDIHFQLIFCPCIRYGCTTRSYIKWGDRNVWLTCSIMIWFWRMYLRSPADAQNPQCCPIEGELKGLPPACIVTGSCDVLRDEGKEYFQALKNNAGENVTVAYVELKGTHIGAMIFDKKGMKKAFNVMKEVVPLE